MKYKIQFNESTLTTNDKDTVLRFLDEEDKTTTTSGCPPRQDANVQHKRVKYVLKEEESEIDKWSRRVDAHHENRIRSILYSYCGGT